MTLFNSMLRAAACSRCFAWQRLKAKALIFISALGSTYLGNGISLKRAKPFRINEIYLFK